MNPTVADLAAAETARSADAVDFDPERSRLLALPLLLTGSVVTVRTRNSSYRLVVVDGAARRVLIKGGWVFNEPTEAEVAGALDDEGVKGGWIVEGLQLQLSTPQGPVVTSTVESITVHGDRAANSSGSGEAAQSRERPF